MKGSITSVFSSSIHVDADGRERWSSRVAFYFAAVGSAVGEFQLCKCQMRRLMLHSVN